MHHSALRQAPAQAVPLNDATRICHAMRHPVKHRTHALTGCRPDEAVCFPNAKADPSAGPAFGLTALRTGAQSQMRTCTACVVCAPLSGMSLADFPENA